MGVGSWGSWSGPGWSADVWALGFVRSGVFWEGVLGLVGVNVRREHLQCHTRGGGGFIKDRKT